MRYLKMFLTFATKDAKINKNIDKGGEIQMKNKTLRVGLIVLLLVCVTLSIISGNSLIFIKYSNCY